MVFCFLIQYYDIYCLGIVRVLSESMYVCNNTEINTKPDAMKTRNATEQPAIKIQTYLRKNTQHVLNTQKINHNNKTMRNAQT